MKKESMSPRLPSQRSVCAISAVFAMLGAPASVGAASPPPLQLGVQAAQDFTPAHTSYVVTVLSVQRQLVSTSRSWGREGQTSGHEGLPLSQGG
jgi:hypothetical protein